MKITVGESGTGGGFEKFCAGETDISDASRPIKPDEEVPVCEKAGVKYEEVQVANDGIAVVTNPNLKVDCLTDRPAQGGLGAQVQGQRAQPRSTRACPAAKLALFGPGTDSGTFDFFTDKINGEEGASREDYEASEDDNQLVTGVAGTDGGPRLLRLLLLRGQPGQAQPGRRRRDRGELRQAVAPRRSRTGPTTSRARCSCTRPTRRWSAPRSRRSWTSSSRTTRTIAEAAKIVPMTDEQASESKAEVDKLAGS